MTSAQLHSVRRHFLEYAKGYLDGVGDARHLMELKREHCAFVARNCRELALASGWNSEDVNAAEALGLLHDIGRFPQLEEYGTFMDARSINHGERGWQAIREGLLLNEVDPKLRAALLDGVLHHNARTIPEDVPEAHLRWVKLIRDADRLDIYRVVLDAIENDKLEAHPEIGMGLSLEGDPCPEVVETILAKQAPSYADLKSFSDFLLLILSWINLMGYPATLRMMRERGIFDAIVVYLPMEFPRVGSLVCGLRKTMDQA